MQHTSEERQTVGVDADAGERGVRTCKEKPCYLEESWGDLLLG